MFIPARSGSKRLPGKNILPLAKRPLIEWTINAALGSEYGDSVVVSTDDEQIAGISRAAGAEVPFLRSAETASDHAPSFAAIEEGLEKLRDLGRQYDLFVLLQPTSPFRTSHDIDRALERLVEKNADSVISITRCHHNPAWTRALDEDLAMDNFLPRDIIDQRSQDLEQHYQLNGAIYAIQTEILLQKRTFFLEENVFGYLMPESRSLDIDTPHDFQFAEFLATSGSM